MTGLEWEDPEHVNRISATEHRKLCLILTQIAVLVNKRKLVLRPYFQDYELVRKIIFHWKKNIDRFLLLHNFITFY